MDDKNNIKELIKEWIRLDYIRPEDIPSIELYMDQVTTFMDKELANTTRFESDKTLTKTMINNYTKNHLLPPPVKKKYSKEHLFLLIYIYYFKNSLSIMDIQSILKPMLDCYAKDTDTMNNIYKTIFDAEHIQFKQILQSIDATHNLSKSLFLDYPEEEQEYLNNFALLALLSYDIYLKKKLMEKIIDNNIAANDTDNSGKESKKN